MARIGSTDFKNVFKKEKLRIAILGSRCLPAHYGGTEAFTEVLSLGLVALGHKVTVYCCAPYQSERAKLYRGIHRITLPTIRLAALEKLIYAALSFIYVCFQDVDIILMNQVGGGPFCILPRLFGKYVVINPDGLEWKRSKWNWLGAKVLKLFEFISVVTANCIVADSQEIGKYILETYGKTSVYIPYGSDPALFEDIDFDLTQLNFKPNSYCIQVCRLEPENNSHLVISEFMRTCIPLSLVIVGGSPFSKRYVMSLHQNRDPRIHLLGSIYGPRYRALMKNGNIYIHGHEVGGTNPVLLDAMAAGKCIIALDVPFNREVLADTGLFFTKTPGDLASKIEYITTHPKEVERFGMLAKKRAIDVFPWSRTVREHEALFKRLLGYEPRK